MWFLPERLHLEEKNYIFEHAWRQVVKKFYRTDIQGVEIDTPEDLERAKNLWKND